MGHHFMGIEIGGTKIQVFITDEDHKIIERDKFFVKEKEASYITKNLNERLKASCQKYNIDAI